MYAKGSRSCVSRKPVAFANISLTRNFIVDRISDLSANLNSQLKSKIKRFITFSVAIDESTDITDIAQLTTFIRVVEMTLIVSEEFVEMVPMSSTTTAADIFTHSLAPWVELEWNGLTLSAWLLMAHPQ